MSSTEEHFKTTGPAGELMIAIAAWIAKQESNRNSERVRAGLSRAKAQGTRSGNAVSRPKEIFKRDLVSALRAEGKSWREIARACKAGVTTVRGLTGRFRAVEACQNRASRVRQAMRGTARARAQRLTPFPSMFPQE